MEPKFKEINNCKSFNANMTSLTQEIMEMQYYLLETTTGKR